jgi:hypothetical protein
VDTMTPLQAAAYAAGVIGGLARRLERQNPRYVNEQWLKETAVLLREAEQIVLEACRQADREDPAF